MIKVSPSILSANFNELGADVKRLEQCGADYIHIDVMDGHFVPNITLGSVVMSRLREVTSLPLDVHLMISQPAAFIEDFIKAGAAILTVQYESTVHLDRLISQVRSLGAKPSVAINPATPIELIFPVLSIVDQVLIMTVNPGFAGQRFIPYCMDKIAALKKKLGELNLHVDIQVDGGVTETNAASLINAGVDVLVAGSTVFQSKNMAETISRLKQG
ncbi:MAG: ribulose-phosphate 3-epimerase [Candidatus Margulisiibacteriota bacterium]